MFSLTHTVSMKFFSTLLNKTMPIPNTNSVSPILTPQYQRGINAPPKKANRKISIIAVIGFSISSQRKESITIETGYTTGVAYIHNCTPKETNNDKSLYFVVIEDTIMPHPSPKQAICNSSTGVARTHMLILASLPLSINTARTPKNSTNCMAKVNILVITVEIGITKRGKYTLPKIFELVTNVLAVVFRHAAK